MPLTDTAARKAQPGEKSYKLADTLGLHLFVSTTGFKSWRYKYRFGGKERRLVIGPYPEVSIAEARDRRDEARRMLRDNKDPGVEREKAKVAATAGADATFRSVAIRWHETQKDRWSPRYGRIIMGMLDRDVVPAFGKLPIAAVTGKMVLDMLRKVEKRGAIETAHRIRQYVSAIFVFAIAEELVTADPASSLGKGLKRKPASKKFPAITEIKPLRAFVKAVEDSPNIVGLVKLASRLLSLTAVRPGVLAKAPWEEFEGIDWSEPTSIPDRPIWRISAERMKLDVDEKGEKSYDLVLPLTGQAVELLRSVRRETNKSPFVFPGRLTWRRPISADTIRMAYRRLGYGDDHVPHGWRAAFSTIMNERAKAALKSGDITRKDDRQYIDMMLAHVPEGMSASELRYNRQEHMEDFARIAQEWADLLLAGCKPASELLFID